MDSDPRKKDPASGKPQRSSVMFSKVMWKVLRVNALNDFFNNQNGTHSECVADYQPRRNSYPAKYKELIHANPSSSANDNTGINNIRKKKNNDTAPVH
jgi:hypothetical protein